MKQIVFKYGVIGGIILSAMVFVLMATTDPVESPEGNKWIGNIFIIAAFSTIYFGIREQRDKLSGGIINFNKAFRTGLLISIIAAAFYSVTWLVYFNFIDNTYLEKSITSFHEQLKASGKSTEEMTKELDNFKTNMENYKKPGVMAFYTFMEMFPFGLIISVLCGFLMKRKNVE